MAAGIFEPQAAFSPPFGMSFPYTLTQGFDILNNFMAGGHYSLVSVNLGQSSNPEVERQVLEVASYGKQLGRIGDALKVLIDRMPDREALTPAQEEAIFALESLLYEIGQAKKSALKG